MVRRESQRLEPALGLAIGLEKGLNRSPQFRADPAGDQWGTNECRTVICRTCPLEGS